MRKLLLFLSVLTLTELSAKTIPLTKNYYANAADLKYVAGDTLLINTTRASQYLYNVVGTADKWIVIMPAPNVTIQGTDARSFKFEVDGSRYFKVIGITVTGNGPGAGAGGFKFYYDSDFTLENLTANNVDRTGFIIKNDPNPADPATYYPAQIKNVTLINCAVYGCNNEGFYIGSTKDSLNGKKNSLINGLKLRNIIAKNTGWDGIQVTGTTGIDADGLTAVNTGLLKAPAQQSGITIQDATSGSFKNIVIDGSTASGLFIFSKGVLNITNVVIRNVYSNGIFIDGRTDRGLNLPAQQLIAENITIEGGGTGAPLVYGNTAPKPIAGTVTNFVYDKSKWVKPLSDPYNVYASAPVTPVRKPLFSLYDELNKKTYRLFSDSTWSAQ